MMIKPVNISALPPIGAAIKKRRRLLGLTQERLAERTGLKRAYIGDLELKERNVSIRTLIIIAGALGMKTSELVALAEDSLESDQSQEDTANEGSD